MYIESYSRKDGFFGASGAFTEATSVRGVGATGGGEEQSILSSGSSVVGEIIGDSGISIHVIALCGEGR